MGYEVRGWSALVSWTSVVGLLINNSIKDNLLRDDLLKGEYKKMHCLPCLCHLIGLKFYSNKDWLNSRKLKFPHFLPSPLTMGLLLATQ